MSMPSLTGAWSGRRRAWLLTGCVVLMVITYLLGWTAYAANGLVIMGRLQQLAPGETAVQRGAEHRPLRLVRTQEVLPFEYGEPAVAGTGATWVIAEIEVTRREAVPEFYCVFTLVGPDRRRWEPSPPSLQRRLPSSCQEEEMPIGQPYRVEVIFSIPDRFLNQIYGVGLTDPTSRKPTLVLRPPPP